MPICFLTVLLLVLSTKITSLLIYYALRFLDLSLGSFVTEFISSMKILLVFISSAFVVKVFFAKLITGISLDFSIFRYQFSPEFLSVLTAVLISLVLGIFCIIVFDKQAAQEFLNALRRKK